jgi:hypothetical protein
MTEEKLGIKERSLTWTSNDRHRDRLKNRCAGDRRGCRYLSDYFILDS